MNDARFEDAQDNPLRLKAEHADDIPVMSTLLQDAIFPSSEMSWRPDRGKFAILLNRYRWELNQPTNATPERVQTVLEISDVLAVRTQGLDKGDKDLILSLLTIEVQQKSDLTGRMTLTLAGDGAIALDIECVNATLTDVTKPYVAPSGLRPSHSA